MTDENWRIKYPHFSCPSVRDKSEVCSTQSPKESPVGLSPRCPPWPSAHYMSILPAFLSHSTPSPSTSQGFLGPPPNKPKSALGRQHQDWITRVSFLGDKSCWWHVPLMWYEENIALSLHSSSQKTHSPNLTMRQIEMEGNSTKYLSSAPQIIKIKESLRTVTDQRSLRS